MARTPLGKSLTEKHYTKQKSLAWGLAYLVRAFWRTLNTGSRGSRPTAHQTNSWLNQVIAAIKYYREMSLATAHQYFIDYVAIEAPHELLMPELDSEGQPYRAAWGASDAVVDKSMEKVHRTLLDGRISDIPGATERIVDDRIFIEQYDVEGAPTVEEIMGEGWGRHDDEPDPGTPDAPDEVVDGKELERSRSRSHQPIVLVRDTHPVHEGYAKAKLTTAGPGGYARRAEKIESVTPRVEDGESEEAAQAGRLEEQSNKSFVRVANAAATMANGGNSLIHRAAVNHSMGYYRVLGPNPCSFCLALAAQGVIYGADAYYDTNQRFTGQGTAKVHDGCQCSLEPVSMVDGTEALPPGVAEARDMWNSLRGQMAGMNSQERLAYFRRVVKDGKIDERAVLKEERPELRERREELWVTIPGLMVQLSFWKKWKEDHPQTTEAAEHAESMLREQLEMRLQQWDRYAFPETDWTAEYDFMLGRAASIYDDQTYAGYVVRGDTPRAAAMERRGEVETTQFTYEFATWLREQKPDAHELHEKYWPEQITAETFK